MNAYWCGFNGFNQISTEISSISSSQFCLVPLNNIEDVDFAWACAVVISAGDAFMCGFDGTSSSFLQKLTKPEPQLKFLEVACNETYALLTSEDGECWQYFYNTKKWKKLLKFTSVEGTTDVGISSKSSGILSSNLESLEECRLAKDKKNIVKICCGETVNIALDNCGQAYSIPSPISMAGVKIMEVACGFEHCLLLDDLGRVYSTGSGMRGQLGSGTLETVDSPQEIEALGGLQVIHIAAGGWHSAAVTASGVLYTWGWNNSGQLGFPTVESTDTLSTSEHNVEQRNLQNQTSQCCSNTQSDLLYKDEEKSVNCVTKECTKCAIGDCKSSGPDDHKNKKLKLTVREEENKQNDRLGCLENEVHGSESSKICENREGGSKGDSAVEQKERVTVSAVPMPVDFPMGKDVDVVDVSCGNRHTIALAGDGSVWGCGWNAYGQLGKSPNTVVSVDCMVILDIQTEEKICRVHCGGWNSVVFCKK
ncbi:hypothetical protein R5R35_002750 [Gryllus longicercus]|uniref:Uncharacterized protein n=1 Tax=Gryllus longicercus TaxID=2509291 RepID=A0AAN9VLI4_9ORTH